ncbi:MAG: Type II secretion system protein E [Parcubacteria group bacterium GW2011_GWA1_44_13]|uniref:Type II secretion system protein E n=1 Tax=Candidatus Nomurabacteria bacterium GW2011_GWB1_44_12 TaxID=1618748 RepID=A0A837I8N9_9BACT|nr:MAG: Type II secretion system protein E [Candidatus Nomurabacteria bacterium GW2011_GWB1_44_12]KKT37651.1 MAG: Type II secretion system protein E [Parcubacteria group bacterium GW2011_GWA1_44_13]KKT59547.1 MAG: Type II secretion system protein E [Parcubacteria group bacterium GW2011_GWC1_44_26]
MHIAQEKLKSIVLESGLVTEEDFAVAVEESRRTGHSIQNIIIGRGKIPEDYFAELLSPYYGVPIVNLKKEESETINSEVLELIPEAYAKAKNVVLFEYDKKQGRAKLAMLDPFDYDTIEYVRAKLGAWVDVFLTTVPSLRYGLKQYKKKVGINFDQIISENVEQSLAVSGDADVAKLAAAVPIVSILDNVIDHAVSLNSSDIHFEPLDKELLVRFRIDGIMQEIVSLPQTIAPVLVARVKILAGMQIDEHRVPQDGRFRFDMDDGGSIDVRVNIMPVFHGEKVEMRILKGAARPLTLKDLGVSDEGIAVLYNEIKKPHGMILVTGPTGHGKTTSLYAILQILNTPSVNITTIEDPVEYEFPRVNQTQVNPKAGITFANGLRALLRQNPDIIMIGEIRDNETVEIAIHAALTGHLVLSSLHTNDATSALPRLLDMGAPAFLLSSTVNIVIAQRLVRRICASCTESYPASPEIVRLIQAQMALSGNKEAAIPSTLYRGRGCKVCGNSGFQGQIGIFELFRVTDAIRELILREATVGEIRKKAVEDGMTTMFEDGLDKVERGVTTIEEILRVVNE